MKKKKKSKSSWSFFLARLLFYINNLLQLKKKCSAAGNQNKKMLSLCAGMHCFSLSALLALLPGHQAGHQERVPLSKKQGVPAHETRRPSATCTHRSCPPPNLQTCAQGWKNNEVFPSCRGVGGAARLKQEVGQTHARHVRHVLGGPTMECATKSTCRLQQFWEKSTYLCDEYIQSTAFYLKPADKCPHTHRLIALLKN